MADVSIQFTDNDRYLQVVHQRGRVVLDGELNYDSRVARIAQCRAQYIEDSGEFRNSGDPGMGGIGKALLVPTFKNIRIRTDGTDSVVVEPISSFYPAVIQAFGYVFELTAPTDPIPTTPNNTGANTFQQIYFNIEETEANAATDPTLAESKLGPTAARVELVITWKVGNVDEDAGPVEWDASLGLEPWRGGKASFLVANIARAQGGGDITDEDILPIWRLPDAHQRLNDRYFTGVVRLHSSHRLGAGAAGHAYCDSKNVLSIRNLAVQVGISYDGTPDSYLSVMLNGDFSIQPGGAVVVIVPTRALEAPSGNHEYIGRQETDSEPGPGELRVITVSNLENLTSAFNDRDQNLDNYVVVATHMIDVDDQGGVGPYGDTYWVFADGKRITYTTSDRFPGEGRVYWDWGNTWEETYEHDDRQSVAPTRVPNLDSDKLPRRRRYLTASQGSLNLVDEQALRNEADDDDVRSGTLMMHRTYFARNYRVNHRNVFYTITGKIETINAVYNPGNDIANPDPVGDGSWDRDVAARGSMITYDCITETDVANDYDTGIQIFRGHSYHARGQPTPWGPSDWEDYQGINAGIHVAFTGNGGLSHDGGSSNLTPIIDSWYAVQYSLAQQPVVQSSGTVTPAVPTGRHFACTRPLAYGCIYTDGAGGAEVLDGSMNIESVTITDEGGGSPNNRAYLVITLTTNGTNVTNYFPMANVMVRPNVTQHADIESWFYHVTPSVQPDGTCRVYMISDRADGLDTFQRLLATERYSVVFYAFGGW